MASGAASLNLVRDELFVTIEEAEQSLEHFISERDNGSLLQQAVEALHQVRGTLNLIELVGAELLAQEILAQATDIPAGVGSERDQQLSALSNALHVLRRYLENLEANRLEFPELLLPAINELRQTGGQPPLPESFFYSLRLDHTRPVSAQESLGGALNPALLRRFRQMYQAGLIGFIREQDPLPGARLMLRALSRLDGLIEHQERSKLIWVACAALESYVDGQLLSRKERKLLFAKVDREIKSLMTKADYQPARSLLKELLYLVTLANTHGPRAAQVREVFGLTPLPFTDHLLQDEYQRLAGPGKAVLRSLSTAIQEELVSVKDMIDQLERGNAQPDTLSALHLQMGKLAKTLVMVGLTSASQAIAVQLPKLELWQPDELPNSVQLNELAESVLYVESMVASLERRPHVIREVQAEPQSFAAHQLLEAHIVVVDEAKAGLALAKRSITSFLETSGDKMHLANVPFSLQVVRGGLWFIDQPRAAALVAACAEYIRLHMIEAPQMPSEQRLETLADALSSLEYYLESGGLNQPDASAVILNLAEESVRTLGMQVDL